VEADNFSWCRVLPQPTYGGNVKNFNSFLIKEELQFEWLIWWIVYNLINLVFWFLNEGNWRIIGIFWLLVTSESAISQFFFITRLLNHFKIMIGINNFPHMVYTYNV